MKNTKKNSISKLKTGVNSVVKSAESADLNKFKQLAEIFLNTPDKAKREKAVRTFIYKQKEFTELVQSNADLFANMVEQALIELATGYYVTDETVKIDNGRKTVIQTKRYIPPNAKAVEFYLTNKKPDEYNTAAKQEPEDCGGVLNELMEAVKNAK